MMIIGLTGGVGCGKSTVAKLFAALGIDCIDADVIARDVVQPHSPALLKIVNHFGASLLLPSGELNRSLLRRRIFENSEEKRWLENLLHPLILAEIHEKIQTLSAPYGMVIIPLLIETGPYPFIDRILWVDAPIKQQIERIMQRDHLTKEQAKAMIKQQAKRCDRLKQAHDVIDNAGDVENLRTQVQKLHEKYLLMRTCTE